MRQCHWLCTGIRSSCIFHIPVLHPLPLPLLPLHDTVGMIRCLRTNLKGGGLVWGSVHVIGFFAELGLV